MFGWFKGPKLLPRARNVLESRPVAALAGRIFSATGRSSGLAGSKPPHATPGRSISIFRAAETTGRFPRWAAGESRLPTGPVSKPDLTRHSGHSPSGPSAAMGFWQLGQMRLVSMRTTFLLITEEEFWNGCRNNSFSFQPLASTAKDAAKFVLGFHHGCPRCPRSRRARGGDSVAAGDAPPP